MNSAKVVTHIIDRSFQIPHRDSARVALVIESDFGEPFKLLDFTSSNDVIRTFGLPKREYTTYNSALFIADHNKKISLVRVVGEGAKYASVLLNTTEQFLTSPIVQYKGLTDDDIRNFNFPTEITTRTYKAYDGNKVVIERDDSNLTFESKILLSQGDKISFSDALDSDVYTVISATTVNEERDIIKLNKAVNVSFGQELNTLFENVPAGVKILSEGSLKNIVVTSHDYVKKGDKLKDDDSIEITSKTVNTMDVYVFTLDRPTLLAESGSEIHVVDTYEVADIYATLLYAISVGVGGNDISVYTARVSGYDDSLGVYKIVVSLGDIKEEFIVSNRDDVFDDFGESLFVEYVVNSRSKLIRAIANPNVTERPLFAESAIWLRNPDPVYRPITTLAERVFKGDKQLYVESTDGLTLGDKIVIRKSTSVNKGELFIRNVTPDDYNEVSLEYTIQEIDSANNSLVLNREIRQLDLAEAGSEVLYLDTTYNDADQNIVNGFKVYEPIRLSSVLYNLRQYTNYKVGSYFGTVLDPGVKNLAGGDNGLRPTASDFVTGVETIRSNVTNLDIPYVADGGYTNLDFANRLVDLKPHAYLSLDKQVEQYGSISDIVDWKLSLGIDDYTASIFAGWESIYSQYTKTLVDIPFSTIAVLLQASAQGELRAIAGLRRGVFNSRRVLRDYNENERDILVNNRINPFIYTDGGAISIWGDETMLTRPSPLQMRSVVLLIADIEWRLNGALKNELFEYNNLETWERVETIIKAMLRDDYQAKGALFDYKVAVTDIITDTDIDNRRMPIFVGIQPTPSINLIELNINVFNKSIAITY